MHVLQKKYKATTNSNHQLPVAPNLLQQNFSSHRPNEKWVSDITYIWTDEGWLYLAVVMDLCSRKVVGWALCERMTKQLVIDALCKWRYGIESLPEVLFFIQTGAVNIVHMIIRNF